MSQCDFDAEVRGDGRKRYTCKVCGFQSIWLPPVSQRLIREPCYWGLGDRVAFWLAMIGVTKQRWAALWGGDGCTPCGQRQTLLNRVGDWLMGKLD